ncbi:hypothetical protein QR98_0067800 [Sarcoptes scabiei]|uniref:Uncharacterized protein n=1 Tax=Sarcoptes scabiei TaxID=52283 RepID=A0A132ABA6_SARSC|nr:hypothetical protein QR98_0067800 [Sarcoptes scabiei]
MTYSPPPSSSNHPLPLSSISARNSYSPYVTSSYEPLVSIVLLHTSKLVQIFLQLIDSTKCLVNSRK